MMNTYTDPYLSSEHKQALDLIRQEIRRLDRSIFGRWLSTFACIVIECVFYVTTLAIVGGALFLIGLPEETVVSSFMEFLGLTLHDISYANAKELTVVYRSLVIYAFVPAPFFFAIGSLFTSIRRRNGELRRLHLAMERLETLLTPNSANDPS